jgi:hypothetical protein
VTFVSTFDEDALDREFRTIPSPRTKLVQLANAAVEVTPDSVGGRVKLGPFKRIWKSLFEESALDAAAWRWIKPRSRRAEIAHLQPMRNKLGLSYFSEVEFCDRLIDACLAMQERYPALERHIDGRIADLQFVIRGASSFGDEINREFEVYQRQLLTAAFARGAGSSDLVGQLGRNVLAATAAYVRAILHDGTEPCPIHANLMVPANITGTVEDVHGALGPFATPAAARATRLWRGLGGSVHRVLVVMAETHGSSYRGFWVPDVRPRGVYLPGAPRALGTGAAQAVAVDDLPPFPGGNDEVASRWQRYLRGDDPGHFQGRMFVSIPVFLRHDEHNSIASAIINVHVIGERPWRRAYSRHWLDLVTRRVSQWASTALHALALEVALGGVKMPLGLPALATVGLLPQGNPNGSER